MTWRVANSLIKLRNQIDSAIPKRDKSSDGTIGDASHASRSSDHNPWVKDGSMGVVTAIDITHDPKNGVDTYKLFEILRQKKDPRIKYVISNRRIFSFEVKPWEIRTYNGSNPHDQHIHISVRELKSLYDWDKPWELEEFIPNDHADPVPDHKTLKYGSIGDEVALVQKLLNMTPELTSDNRGIITKAMDKALGKPDPDPKPWFGPRTEKAVKDFQTAKAGLVVDGIVGPYTWRALEGGTEPGINRNITATVFGGTGDPNRSAYTNKLLNDTDLYIALPYRFLGVRPKVKVTNRSTGTSVVATIEDVGPWNTYDPYWATNSRPQAESGTDNTGRKTNRAGIDLSPAVAKLLGINGKGTVDWSFVNT